MQAGSIRGLSIPSLGSAHSDPLAVAMYPQSNSTPFHAAAGTPALFASWTPKASYYVATLVVLLVAWLLRPKSQPSKLSVPFYGASKLKWIFDAESQIVTSYNKVGDRALDLADLDDLQADSVSRSSLPNQGYRRNSSHDSPKVHCRAQGTARGHPQLYRGCS